MHCIHVILYQQFNFDHHLSYPGQKRMFRHYEIEIDLCSTHSLSGDLVCSNSKYQARWYLSLLDILYYITPFQHILLHKMGALSKKTRLEPG